MAEKFTLPAGTGYYALYLPWDQLRRIAELPPDVETIRVLPGDDKPPMERANRNAWMADPPPEPFYLLISHPYFPRVPPNCIYCVARLDEVLQQYHEVFHRILEADRNAVA
jgi:hypothetical protein